MIEPSLSYADYAALPGLRWSVLRHMGDSPRHCKHAALNQRESAERTLLRAIHAAVLERRQSHVVWTGESRRGKVWDLFREAHAGRDILTVKEDAVLQAVVSAVHTHPEASRLLTRGEPEVSLTWDDFKGRIDWLGPDYLVDLKTLDSTDASSVARLLALHQYHGQMAHYRDGLRRNGVPVDRVYLIVAEGSRAHDVAVFDLDDDSLREGLRLRDEYAARYRECNRIGHWPGRHQEIAPLGLPDWAAPKEVAGE